MIRVMIVDDELLSRIGIKSLLPWEDNGYQIVGEAENGEKAIELLDELTPDIIITDMKMPEMNGLEMIRHIKAQNKDIRFIVISAYDDFEYVRASMKEGADDYILKLDLEKDVLLRILEPIKVSIISEKRNKDVPVDMISDRLPAIREKVIKDLIFGVKKERDNLAHKLEMLNIPIVKENILTMVFTADVTRDIDNADMIMLNSAIFNTLQDMVLNYNNGYLFTIKPFEYGLIYSVGDNSGYIGENEELNKLSARVIRLIKKYYNITLKIGVSNIHQDFTDLSKAFYESIEVLDKTYKLTNSNIRYYADFKTTNAVMEIALDEEISNFETALRYLDIKKIKQTIWDINSKIRGDGKVTVYYLTSVCSTIIYMLVTFMKGKNVTTQCIDFDEMTLYKSINELHTKKDFILWYEALDETIEKIVCELTAEKSEIRKAKGYIEKHYSENIILKQIADYVGMSQNYFSNLFKKETGITFVDYLTTVRINKAKEMLRNQEMKVYEVGEKVGYENLQYFSKIFKKHVGVSPKSYKMNQES